ncbi:MAG: hypothetical protein RJA10_2769 [Pseudomonadota bacterium]|jgi:hypothetical protein
MTVDLLTLFYLSQPFVIAVGLALAVAAFGGAVLSRPVVPLALYAAVYFVFAQSNYGSMDVFVANPIYARGTGQLFFPALCWTLLVMVAWAALGRAFVAPPPAPPSPVRRVLVAWGVLLLLHLLVGLALDVPATEVLGSNGFMQMVWMLPLVQLMHWSGGDDDTLDTLGRMLVLAALAKALFGLGRFAFFGGDPSNVYQNWGHLDVKLTYFDVCDSLVCLLGAAVAASTLFVAPSPRHGLPWRLLCALTLVLALACIVLSYRRTAWGGLVLAMAWLAWQMHHRVRWPALMVALPVGVAAVGWVAAGRLSLQAGSGSGVLGFFFDLVGSRYGPESSRLLELQLAWKSFLDSPIVGLGSWGRYAGSQLIPWQRVAGGGFLHSGVLHLMLKAGLVGLLLLVALAWAYGRELRQAATRQAPAARALCLASGCGLLFMVPDLLFGTPVPQLRTMQMLALCLGLPGLVAAAVPALSARRILPARPGLATARR